MGKCRADGWLRGHESQFMIGGPFDQRGEEPSNLIRQNANARTRLWITRGASQRSGVASPPMRQK